MFRTKKEAENEEVLQNRNSNDLWPVETLVPEKHQKDDPGHGDIWDLLVGYFRNDIDDSRRNVCTLVTCRVLSRCPNRTQCVDELVTNCNRLKTRAMKKQTGPAAGEIKKELLYRTTSINRCEWCGISYSIGLERAKTDANRTRVVLYRVRQNKRK